MIFLDCWRVFGNRSGRAFAASTLHSATCTGSDPCNACKNCRYCHCAKEGGKCGACK